MARPQRALKRSVKLLDGLSEDEDLLPTNAMKRQRATQEMVRVWWPPTRDKSRTGFSGAFWPAAVVGRGKSHFTVRYDNGEQERVHCENIFPFEVPIDFGREIEELEVGEFVEVSNGSRTDPCAWLGCVSKVSNGSYVVKYPFHDAPDETIKWPLIRRARIWDGDGWKFIEPRQKWKDGEVASPKELNLVTEKEFLKRHLGGGAGGGGGGSGRGQRAAAAAAAAAEGEPVATANGRSSRRKGTARRGE